MTGPFASVNGQRVIAVSLTIPWYGTWAADVTLASEAAIGSPVTLVIGDLSLVGAVYRVLDFSGSRSARLVGGAAGWLKEVPSKAYQLDSGVPLSMILNDAAMECGESWNQSDLSTYAPGNVGSTYVRESGPAQRVLAQLAGALWWIDTAGKTRLAPRASTPIQSAFEVIHYTGGQGLFEIATEVSGDWMPGRTFTSPTVTTPQTVGMTNLVADNSGKARLQVLSA